MTVKAYVVKDRNGHFLECEMVFAESTNQARTKAYRVGECVDYVDRSAKRAPEFDKYIGTGVPANRQLFEEHGWWFLCKCGRTTTSDDGKWVGDGVICDECSSAEV